MHNSLLKAPSLERMWRAMEAIYERLARAVRVLEEAQIDYAVIGGHAVREWIGRIDITRQRHTRDVDILVRRADLPRIIATMTADGFIHSNVWGVDLFIENENVKASEGVHLLFEGEKVKPDSTTAAPLLTETEASTNFRVLKLDALLRMKLEAYRLKDQMHISDMKTVGLVDETSPERFPSPLKERLAKIVNDPNERPLV